MNRTNVLVTILVVLASIRAVEATLNLIGRFASSEKPMAEDLEGGVARVA